MRSAAVLGVQLPLAGAAQSRQLRFQPGNAFSVSPGKIEIPEGKTAAMQVKGEGELHYTWTVSGGAVIKEVAPANLIHGANGIAALSFCDVEIAAWAGPARARVE